LIAENNAKVEKRWCDDHKTWMSNDWKYIIWSNKSSFTLLPKSGQVYIWRTLKEAYNSECLVPTVKRGGRSVMIWAALSWYLAGPLITLYGWITASEYVDILGNQLHPVVEMFPKHDAVF
jgi:hypothetical protein